MQSCPKQYNQHQRVLYHSVKALFFLCELKVFLLGLRLKRALGNRVYGTMITSQALQAYSLSAPSQNIHCMKTFIEVVNLKSLKGLLIIKDYSSKLLKGHLINWRRESLIVLVWKQSDSLSHQGFVAWQNANRVSSSYVCS